MIKKGDLVMVTRPTPCCASDAPTGKIFVVDAVAQAAGFCVLCGAERHGLAAWNDQREGGWIDVYRLTKIDPPPIHEQIIEEAVA